MNDMLPKIICQNCYNFVLEWAKWKCKALKSNEIINYITEMRVSVLHVNMLSLILFSTISDMCNNASVSPRSQMVDRYMRSSRSRNSLSY